MEKRDHDEHKPTHETPIEKARHGIEQAEAGDTTGVRKHDEAHAADAVDVEAVDQEASDGPTGRGLAR